MAASVGRLGKSFAADLASSRFQFQVCRDIIERREVFKTRALVACRDFDRLKSVVDCWKEDLASGATQYEPEREKSLKVAFRRWLALATFLLQNWDENEVVPSRPERSLRHRAQTATRIIDDWEAFAIHNDLKHFLANFTRGRSVQDMGFLDTLAKKAVSANQAREGEDVEEWSRKLAVDLAKFED